MYEPGQPPGFTMEHLFDEEFVLVTSTPGSRRQQSDYVFVDWGPAFQADHTATYPELNKTSVALDLGSMGIDYLLANKASGYFPRRLVKHHVTRRRLRIPARSRSFASAVYMVYPEARDEEAFRTDSGLATSGRSTQLHLRDYIYGYWNRQMVQRNEGLWLHPAGHLRCGRLRPHLGGPASRIERAQRGPEGQFRG